MSILHFVTDVTVMVDKNATVATIDLFDSQNLEAVATVTGSAKREQGDPHNEAIAVNLAMGRAFEKLGRELGRRGRAAVKAAEIAAEAKRVRKEKRTAAVAVVEPVRPHSVLDFFRIK